MSLASGALRALEGEREGAYDGIGTFAETRTPPTNTTGKNFAAAAASGCEVVGKWGKGWRRCLRERWLLWHLLLASQHVTNDFSVGYYSTRIAPTRLFRPHPPQTASLDIRRKTIRRQ